MTDDNRGVVLLDDDTNEGTKGSKYAKRTEEEKNFILQFIAHVQEQQGCGVTKAIQQLQEKNPQFKGVSERSVRDWKKKVAAKSVAADMRATMDRLDDEFVVEDIPETPSLGRPCVVSAELRERIKAKVSFFFVFHFSCFSRRLRRLPSMTIDNLVL